MPLLFMFLGILILLILLRGGPGEIFTSLELGILYVFCLVFVLFCVYTIKLNLSKLKAIFRKSNISCGTCEKKLLFVLRLIFHENGTVIRSGLEDKLH